MENNFISLFTGAGGLDWGFHQQNFNLVLSNEILQSHLKTYTDHYNINLELLNEYDDEKNVGICGDVHKLDVKHKADLVIGGPPCQDFSVLRGKDKREGFEVTRGRLYQQYLRIINSSKPEIFVFENVPGMVSANKGLAYQTIQEDFMSEGYELVYNSILNISEIGAPQSRRRLIIIGIKKELINEKVKEEISLIINENLSNNLLKKYPLTPIETFEGKTLDALQVKYESIIKEFEGCTDNIDNEMAKKWIDEYNSLTFNIKQDYIKANNIESVTDDEYQKAMVEHEKILKILGFYNKKIDEQQFLDNTNKLPRKNKKVTERLHHIPPFYNFKTVENTPWKVKGLMSNIYRRLHPLIPSSTIIAYGGGGTGGYHYEYNRQGLTNRERARLQTFPDDYLFNGKTSEIRAQIGEAVPPIASHWIAKTVVEVKDLINNEKRS